MAPRWWHMNDPALPADPADWLPPEEPEPYDLSMPGARRMVDPRTLAARFHHLKAAGQSGAHALLAFQGDSGDTLARRIGSGAHALLFRKPVAVWDQPSEASLKRVAKGKPAGKESKAPRSGAAWKLFVEANPGAIILTGKERDQASRIVDAIHGNGFAERLLFGPGMIHERSIIWSQLGRARQSTPDARGREHLVELKTTRCAAPRKFLWDAEKLCYHAQLADQRAAIAYETGKAPRETYIVAVENVAPYCVTVIELLPSAIERGEKLCQMWLDRLQVYEAARQWGGYTNRIEQWEMVDHDDPVADPSWAEPEPAGVE